MPAQPDLTALIRLLRIPDPGLQRIDMDRSAHDVHIAATQGLAELHELILRVQADHALAVFQEIRQQQFEKEGLALAGVAQNQGAAGGLVLRAALQIHDDLTAELVPPDGETVGVRLAGVVERIEVGGGSGGQDPFILRAEHIAAPGLGGVKPLLLAQVEPVRLQAAAGQVRRGLRLETAELLRRIRHQLQVHRAVEERGFAPMLLRHHRAHVSEVAVRRHSPPDVPLAAHGQPVAVGRAGKDRVLLKGRDMAGIDMDGDAAPLTQEAEQRLGFRSGGITPQGPGAAVGVAEEIVVPLELDRGGSDEVQEFLFSHQASVPVRQRFTRGRAAEPKRHELLLLIPRHLSAVKALLMEQGLQHGLPGAVLRALSHRYGQQEPPGGDGLDLELLEALRVLLKESPDSGLRLRLVPPTEEIPVFREALAAVHADELRAVQALEHLHEALDPSCHALPGQDADIGGSEDKIGPLSVNGPDGMFPDLLDPQEVPGGTAPEEAHRLPPVALLSRQRYAWGTRNRNAAHRRQKSSTLCPSTWMARKPYTTVQMAGAVQPRRSMAKAESSPLTARTPTSRSAHSHSVALAVKLSG